MAGSLRWRAVPRDPAPVQSVQPARFVRFTNCAASGAFLARMFGPSHSSFLPVRKATIPSSMISVRYAVMSKRE